ncbi:3-keto-disaccharide hydrolase [Steroidobacter cummioxidans]|uniref:3-keto-disaccharide hydrolase n=1 Tax=Steroidobacter cummioxidans TaxID=1803913 RepID=UPI000E3106DA|nr:DUF1080 domain-containing protein [Steroidobacter cummioxidans]
MRTLTRTPRRRAFAGLLGLAIATASTGQAAAEANRLTERERAEGWQLLWDGATSAGWRSVKSDEFPKEGWPMRDGVLSVRAGSGEESRGGGDIITRKRYADFELSVEFKFAPGANSGLKIFVQPNISPVDRITGKPTGTGSAIGMEFQILDDSLHPDARQGRDGNRTLGSFYDVMAAPQTKSVQPAGEWNHARIVALGKHVTFWLNGQKTVEFDRGSPAFRAAVAASKFKDIPGFGEWEDGHILLQDHGDEVAFRNLKLRELSKVEAGT